MAKKQDTTDLVTFTEEILDEKLHFLCSELRRHDTTQEFAPDKNRFSCSRHHTGSNAYIL